MDGLEPTNDADQEASKPPNKVHKRLPFGVHRGEGAQHNQQVRRHASALTLIPPFCPYGGCFFFDSSMGAQETAFWCAQGSKAPNITSKSGGM